MSPAPDPTVGANHSTPTTFEASAFHSDLPGGREPGRLIVDTATMRFETQGGQVYPLPFEGLELELGGASDRLIFLSHPSVPGLSVFTADHALLQHPALQTRPGLASQLQAAGKKKQRNRMAALGMVAAVIALVMGLVALKDPLVGVVVSQIPPSLEVRLGDVFFSQIEGQTTLVDDDQLEADLRALAAPLIAELPDTGYPFELHLAEDSTSNAFAFPGGNIVVHTGLILEADRPEEVLGVLAHEIAHVTRRHSLRQIVGTVGVLVVVQTLFGDASGLIAAVAEGGTYLLTLEFSRDFERDADDTGWEYLVAAGIDPRGLITFFEKIQAEAADQLGSESLEQNLAFLSTHPSSQERIDRLHQRWNDAGFDTAPVIDPVDFEAFQDRIRQHLGAETSGAEGTDASNE